MVKARIVIDGQTVEVETENANELKNLIREMVSASGSESGVAEGAGESMLVLNKPKGQLG